MPVVFAHGTASSPARWAEMVNELTNDQNLWGHYQFWLFTYNTGNPILYSAGILANGLQKTIQELDPDGKDPALRKMIIIGHSQGGLLTKLTAVDAGAKFWDNASTKPYDELQASKETKEMLRRSVLLYSCYFSEEGCPHSHASRRQLRRRRLDRSPDREVYLAAISRRKHCEGGSHPQSSA